MRSKKLPKVLTREEQERILEVPNHRALTALKEILKKEGVNYEQIL